MTETRKTVALNKCDSVGKIAQTGVGHFSVTERMRAIVAKHFDIQSGYIYCSPQIAENVKVVVRCKDCRWYRDTFFNSKVNPYCVKEFDEEFGALRSGITEDSFCSWGERKGGEDE